MIIPTLTYIHLAMDYRKESLSSNVPRCGQFWYNRMIVVGLWTAMNWNWIRSPSWSISQVLSIGQLMLAFVFARELSKPICFLFTEFFFLCVVSCGPLHREIYRHQSAVCGQLADFLKGSSLRLLWLVIVSSGDRNQPTVLRSCIDIACTSNVVEFLSELGCRMEFEYVLKGYLFRKGRMKVTMSKIFRVSLSCPVSAAHVVSDTCISNFDWLPLSTEKHLFICAGCWLDICEHSSGGKSRQERQ